MSAVREFLVSTLPPIACTQTNHDADQFRWKLYGGRPEVYHPEIFMAKATWTDRTISDWDGHTPMRRQFASSLENAGWASEWNGGRILRMQWSSKRGGRITKNGAAAKGNMSNTHTNLEVGRTHDGTITLHVVRPREAFKTHDARAKIPVMQACDDAASLFNALRSIYEEGGGTWEAKNLALWNDVRDEVVARAACEADVAPAEASVASEDTARRELSIGDVSGKVDDVR
jgi:hypothetical protein